MTADIIQETPATPPAVTSGDLRRADLRRRAERVEGLAEKLDRAVRIPGTDFRVGVDGLIGLIPGVGDTIGAGLSAILIGEAARGGCRKRVLARMAGNVAIDSVLGAVPLLGDVFDIGYKANVKNARLAAEEFRRLERAA
mgnify:CR=1 FL=1